MSSDLLAPVLVPNRYRLALVRAKQASRSDVDGLRDLFRKSMKAFEAGAWEGGLADDRYRQLTGLKQRARSAADLCDRELDQAIRAQLLEVPADSWQARWSPGGGSGPWL